jgi:hypothetical protein
MTKKKLGEGLDPNKPLNFQFSEEVLGQMEADPELAEAVKKFVETAKAADALVKEGKFDNLDDAMSSLGMKPELVEPEDMPDEVLNTLENLKPNTKH